MKNITFEYSDKVEGFSELDFELYNQLLGEGWEWEEREQMKEHTKGVSQCDGFPVKIDEVIDLLEEMKKKYEYVSMHEHCDHIGYEFQGVNIKDTTIEELEDFKKKEEEKEERKRKQKEEEYEKLKKELGK